MKPFFILTILWMTSFSAFSAEVIYRFGGTLSTNWGTLPAGSRFNGYFTYTFPQKAHGFGGNGAWYNFNKLRSTVGRETILIDRGYRFLGQGTVPPVSGHGYGFFGITADDSSWKKNRPRLGGIPVGVVVSVTDNYWLSGGQASAKYLKGKSLVGSGLKLSMFNFTRLVLNDTRKKSINISSPLTTFSGSIVR